jgi:hypothetical protein
MRARARAPRSAIAAARGCAAIGANLLPTTIAAKASQPHAAAPPDTSLRFALTSERATLSALRLTAS